MTTIAPQPDDLTEDDRLVARFMERPADRMQRLARLQIAPARAWALCVAFDLPCPKRRTTMQDAMRDSKPGCGPKNIDTSPYTKRRILAERLGAEPQPVQRVVRYLAERDPMRDGQLWYRVGGVGYPTLKALRAAYPEAKLERIKATRRNRLFG